MALDQVFAFAIILGTIGLLVWDRNRYDLVALLALLASVTCGHRSRDGGLPRLQPQHRRRRRLRARRQRRDRPLGLGVVMYLALSRATTSSPRGLLRIHPGPDYGYLSRPVRPWLRELI
jgi:hypothetical protein